MSEIRIEKFLYPYVRFINACPSVTKADFYYGNTLIQPSLGFGCFSSYFKVSKGLQEFVITEAGNKDNVLATVKLPFANGDVYTVALVHSDGSSMAYGIVEPAERKDTDYGHVRVCHLSPNLGELDISANGYDVLGSIDYLELSRYICLNPGVYEFRARETAGGALKLVMPNQNVQKGKYNTLYIVGLSNENPCLMGIFTVDAASYTGCYL